MTTLKLKILKNGQQTHSAESSQFESLEAFEAWKYDCIDNNVWGKPERWVVDSPMSPLSEEEKATALESRSVEVMGETLVEYKFAAEYTIEIQDITAEVQAEKAAKEAKKIAKEKRKTDRKTIDWSKTMTVKQLQDVVKALVEAVEG